MRIYLGHASSFDYRAELYAIIKNSVLYQNHEIIFPHEASSEPVDSKEIIKNCDAIVAECSYPSTGLGIELGWASLLQKPILCIHKMGTSPSSSLHIITQDIVGYTDGQDMVAKIEGLLG